MTLLVQETEIVYLSNLKNALQIMDDSLNYIKLRKDELTIFYLKI